MGRRKLEMKRIEDKSSRQVTFSKRRAGLIKKVRQLSVLCDVDAAVFVFSARGKLYEFCSGGRSNSVERILQRYKKSCLEAGERTMNVADKDLCPEFRTCKELLQTVDRLVEDSNTEEELSVTVTGMTQLEQELDAALVQTRLRKTQLMMEYISTLQEKETKFSEEREELENLVTLAKQNGAGLDDGGGDLNDLATNQINSPQHVHVTLPLFHNNNKSANNPIKYI